MSKLNENIELFKCYVRASHFTKKEEDKDTYHKAYAFAVQSLAGKILTFHVMTDYGMLRSRVPISEIFMEIPKNDIYINRLFKETKGIPNNSHLTFMSEKQASRRNASRIKSPVKSGTYRSAHK